MVRSENSSCRGSIVGPHRKLRSDRRCTNGISGRCRNCRIWSLEMRSRRERIEAMLADEPGDQFLCYSLAMEFDKEARHDESLALLRSLAVDAQPYVPAFFMAGQQLTRV